MRSIIKMVQWPSMLFALLSGMPPSMGLTEAARRTVCHEMCTARTPEKPARALLFVQLATEEEQEEMAILCVSCVMDKSPGSGTATISTICKIAPHLAPAMAAAAARSNPVYAVWIAQATIAAVPSFSAFIADEVAKAAPASARQIATLVQTGSAGVRGSAHHGPPSSGGPVVISDKPINAARKDPGGPPPGEFPNPFTHPPKRVERSICACPYPRQF